MQQTALVERHRSLGGRLIDFAGWEMPVQYQGILDEHRAVRERAGLFDLSHMGEVWVSGAGAGTGLAAALVSDPTRLAVGRAQYSMICADDGGIIDDLIVYRVADERFMVVPNASNREQVAAALGERLSGHDAALDDASLRTSLVAVQGPRAAEILAPLTDVDLAACATTRSPRATRAASRRCVARTGYTGEDGFELFVDWDDALPVWDALLAAGQSVGIIPCGLGARDTLRLEAGMPLYGNELDATPIRSKRAWDAWSSSTSRPTSSAAPRSSASPRRVQRKQLVGLTVRGRRHRPARLSGPPGRRGRGGGRRHQRRAVADPGRADRDGLRATGGRRDRYHGRGRDSRRAGRGRDRPATVLQARRLGATLGGLTSVQVPDDLRYTPDHEWLRIEGDQATVGITEYAATSWATSSSSSCRRPARRLEPAQSFGVIESVKTASDLYAPAAGEVVETQRPAGRPARAGQRGPVRRGLDDPHAPRRSGPPATSERLMDAEAYRQLIETT